MTLFVNEMYFPDDMEMDGMYGEDMMDQQGGFKIWWVVVPLIVVILIAVTVFVIIRKKKKKKAQELLELEDDFEEVNTLDLEEKTDDAVSEEVEGSESEEE